MNEIFLGAQFGGADAGAKFSGVSVLIRKRLKELKKTYCKDIENFQLFLRVSGEITAFKEFSGIHHIRLLKKKKSVTADIIIAREIWADKNEEQLREYLSLQVIEAISLMCSRIEAEKLEVNTKEFIADLRKIVKVQVVEVDLGTASTARQKRRILSRFEQEQFELQGRTNTMLNDPKSPPESVKNKKRNQDLIDAEGASKKRKKSC